MHASVGNSLRVGAAIGLFLLVLPCILVPLVAGVLISLSLGQRCHPAAYGIAGICTSPLFIALAMKTVGDTVIDLNNRPIGQGIVMVVAIGMSMLFVWVGAQGFRQFQEGLKQER